MDKKGDQIHEEQLDIPQVFPRSYEELLIVRLQACAYENGFELVPRRENLDLDLKKEDEE